MSLANLPSKQIYKHYYNISYGSLNVVVMMLRDSHFNALKLCNDNGRNLKYWPSRDSIHSFPVLVQEPDGRYDETLSGIYVDVHHLFNLAKWVSPEFAKSYKLNEQNELVERQ